MADTSKQNEEIKETIEAPQDSPEEALEAEGSDRSVFGWKAILILIISVALSLYHLYTAGFGLIVSTNQHLFIHLLAGLLLIFLIFPRKKGLGQTTIVWYDMALAGLVLVVGSFVMLNQTHQTILQGNMETSHMIAGIIMILLLLEAARRVVGKPLLIIALIFIAYYFLGDYLPPPFGHGRANFEQFIYEMMYTSTGILGTPLSVSANYVFIFILFGAILEATGAGKMFIDLALRAVGHYRGGPAKAAVVGSGFMGSISGSSVANAVTTGTFTIPLMKKVGFRPQTSGGIEVASSSSGQFLPPVMGAAAFLMIEYTPYSYAQIMISALIPAILTYIAIIWMVHIESVKHNIQGLAKDSLVSGRKSLLQQGYLIVPIIALVYFVMAGNTVFNAAFYSIVMLLTVAILAHRLRERFGAGLLIAGVLAGVAYGMYHLFGWHFEISVMIAIGTFICVFFVLFQNKFNIESAPIKFKARELMISLEMASRKALTVIAACATAGILIGIINLTGLSGSLPTIIVGFAGDQLLLVLFFTFIACLIVGLGLPTTATYVILASMIAPALIEMGVPIMAAHLFVLYYGVLADDTPPVNLPAYAVSGIARADPIITGVQGFKYDAGALLLPFVFTMNTIILLLPENQGMFAWYEIVWAIFTALVGILAFVTVIQNYMFVKYRWFEWILALSSALVFIHPAFISDLIGVGLFALLISTHLLRKRSIDRDRGSGAEVTA
ncbi:TRAP transporter permease [Salicibibacter halophilus]|uniref:TRAP transporter permease n=1 Tax=Salicibibacter halophilus TaxID=2502791 RepID=A0A514LK17_9BACI|nr:TRAP transporter permease [Salicibibacter halophilus]QDI92200.1 TRAP transporter permease [Salicibibacter halophilus]